MKEFDHDLRKDRWKNKDHFHLVQVKDVYNVVGGEKIKEDAFMDNMQALTATVYSQDSHGKEKIRDNKQRYAQILVE